MKTFVAEVRCNGELWILQVPAVDFLSAQAENLLEAEDELREIVARRLSIDRSMIAFELQDVRALRRNRQGARRESRTHPVIHL
jgi:hypothetical protein